MHALDAWERGHPSTPAAPLSARWAALAAAEALREQAATGKPPRIRLAQAIHRRIVAPVARPFSSAIIKAELERELSTSNTVLDVAAGDDSFCLDLARKGKRVTANDIDAEALAYLAEKARAEGLDVRFSLSDVHQLDAVKPFDAVLAKNLLHHLGGAGDVASVLASLLRLGHRLVVLEIEDPRKNILARAWNSYYRKVLGDDGLNFLDLTCFKEIVTFIAPRAKIRTVSTIKGRYMLAVITKEE